MSEKAFFRMKAGLEEVLEAVASQPPGVVEPMTDDLASLQERIRELEAALRPVADQILMPTTNDAGEVRVVLTEDQAFACFSAMIFSHRNMTDSWRERMAARAAGIKTEVLPDWEDLRGRAPDATGGLSSEAFVREIRDEWRDHAALAEGEEG